MPLRRHGPRGRPGDRRQRLSAATGRRSRRAGAGAGNSDRHRPGTLYSRVAPRTAAAARLVWIGQRSTLASLHCLRQHLAAAAERLPGLQLRVISDAAPTLPGVRVVACRWSSAGEAADLARGDIGINWLPDDCWSRGKCGLRVLQYMAAGLPVVANPVGMNCTMVVHGETGFLASTPQEWAEAIARLAAEPRLRQRMGEAGRQFVAQRYATTAWGSRLAASVDAVARDLLSHGCLSRAEWLKRHTAAERGRADEIIRLVCRTASYNVAHIDAIRRIAAAMVCLLLALAGCTSQLVSHTALPEHCSLVRGPLVIHSDFVLPADNRLWDELAARQGELGRRLGLPASDEPVYIYLFQDAGAVPRIHPRPPSRLPRPAGVLCR